MSKCLHCCHTGNGTKCIVVTDWFLLYSIARRVMFHCCNNLIMFLFYTAGCYCSVGMFDRARCAVGTDEDLLVIQLPTWPDPLHQAMLASMWCSWTMGSMHVAALGIDNMDKHQPPTDTVLFGTADGPPYIWKIWIFDYFMYNGLYLLSPRLCNDVRGTWT